MKHLGVLLCAMPLVTTLGAGCGKETQNKNSEAAKNEGHANFAPRKDLAPVSEKAIAPTSAVEPTPDVANNQHFADRKIIFTANISLKVEKFDDAEFELRQLIQSSQGYTAQAEVAGRAGATQQGTWKVRIPATNFAGFCQAVQRLGEMVRYTSDAREITEEYYDLQARVKNKEAELDAFRKIFDKTSGKIEEVFAVQRQLSRAEGELEQLKGRQRVFENLTELTTVTVHLEQRGTYIPPTTPAPVAFGTTVGQSFFGSIEILATIGKALVVAGAAVAPWLPVLGVAGGVTWLVARRRGWRRNKEMT
jgi:Domain of unknown function (DUF4349)